MNFPESISSESELDALLTRPQDALVAAVRQWRSPLVVLGASGKMGPSLCVLARRAADAARIPLRILAVSRFSKPGSERWLQNHDIETISCDLFERESVKKLPDSENVVFLVGLKFGTRKNPSLTWAVNTLVPAHVAERYPAARLVALSTGNVYARVPAASNGTNEDCPPAPLGEYAAAALARERIFEFFSQTRRTPLVLLRLNYAVELRYGVLVDIATSVWQNRPIDLGTPAFNCIWQGDANDLVLRSFALAESPPQVFNLTGSTKMGVEDVARRLGERMRREPRFTGPPGDNALLSDSSRLLARLGSPVTPLEFVLNWTADWVMRGRPSLDQPTHFDVRTGEF